MSSLVPVVVAVVVAVVVGSLAACSNGPTSTDPAQRSTVSTATANGSKQGDGTQRHDLDPLTKRFSALGTPTAATWYSGELGGTAPGPTTYWIDAVIEVSAATKQELLATSPAAAAGQPDVVEALRSSLPSGQLLTGPDLDAKFAQGDFRATAYLSATDNTVVLVALGS